MFVTGQLYQVRVFLLYETCLLENLWRSELLPAAIEEDDLERGFEKFDEDMDSIEDTFAKLEGKARRQQEWRRQQW